MIEEKNAVDLSHWFFHSSYVLMLGTMQDVIQIINTFSSEVDVRGENIIARMTYQRQFLDF